MIGNVDFNFGMSVDFYFGIIGNIDFDFDFVVIRPLTSTLA